MDDQGLLSTTTYSKRLFYICSGDGILNHNSEPDVEGLILEELRRLLNMNADPNYKQKNTYPLCQACRKGYDRVVEELLRRGADVNVSDRNNSSPLYIAASHGHLNICNMLIQKGANVNYKNVYGYTPLWTCIEHNNSEIAKLLCRSGADVNVQRPNSHGFEMKMLTYVLLAKGDTSLAESIMAANCVPYKIENPLSYMILSFDDASRNLMKKLLVCGFEVEYQHWVSSVKHKINTQQNEVSESEINFIRFVTSETRTPGGLQHLSRLVVRKCLLNANPQQPLNETVQKLELPKRLKQLICLHDIININ